MMTHVIRQSYVFQLVNRNKTPIINCLSTLVNDTKCSFATNSYNNDKEKDYYSIAYHNYNYIL